MLKTAIILFADLPEIEARAKNFCSFSFNKASRNISSVLTQHFLNLAKQTNADTFLIDSNLQKGKTFGERITHAFTSIYNLGYEYAICIGNDCPDLSLSQLNNAIDEVQKDKVVLGPTTDGGAYLIAIPRKYFNPNNFKKIKWQTANAYHGLATLFNQKYLIETALLSDIDCASDLQIYDKKNHLVKVLLTIINDYLNSLPSKTDVTSPPLVTISAASLRGPPVQFSLFYYSNSLL